MNYTKNLQLQEMRLRLASGYAATILKADENIEAGNHVNYFKTVRAEAIPLYADAVADIVNSSIDTAIEFGKPNFEEKLLERINTITKDYKNHYNIH